MLFGVQKPVQHGCNILAMDIEPHSGAIVVKMDQCKWWASLDFDELYKTAAQKGML